MTALIRRDCNEKRIIRILISCRGPIPGTGRDRFRPVHGPSAGQSDVRPGQIRRAGGYSRAPVPDESHPLFQQEREKLARAYGTPGSLKCRERQQQITPVVDGYVERTHKAIGEGSGGAKTQRTI